MNNLFLSIQKIIEPAVNAGALFLIFFVFTIIGLIVKLKVLDAIKNGLLIAAGFQGVYVVVDFFMGAIGPAATTLAERFGGTFQYTDIGWAPISALAWGHPLAYAVIALSLIINIIMIFTNLTDTINLNIWDTWHTTATALIVYAFTNDIVITLIIAAGWLIICLYGTDWFSNKGYTEKYFRLNNISFYQGANILWVVFGHLMGKLLDKIPFTSGDKFTPEKIQKRFGVIGEPVMIGGIIGLFLGILAQLHWTEIVVLMIELAASLLILPMMTGLVMQALVPVTDSATDLIQKITKGKKSLYVGIDPAIAVGNPTSMAVTTLMIPFMILFAFIIPGSNTFPLADLASMGYIWVYMVAPNNGDVLKTFITCLVAGALGTLCAIIYSPGITAVAKMQGMDTLNGVSAAVSWYDIDAVIASWTAQHMSKVGVAIVMIVIVAVGTIYRISYNTKRAKSVESAAK